MCSIYFYFFLRVKIIICGLSEQCQKRLDSTEVIDGVVVETNIDKVGQRLHHGKKF